VSSVGQSPTDLVLDAALRVGQLAEAVARVAAFDAANDELCVPERITVAPTAPMRRPAPVDPLAEYAVKATTASLIGAAATLLWKRNLDQASAAVRAGSPTRARYGWGAYQAGVGCALAAALSPTDVLRIISDPGHGSAAGEAGADHRAALFRKVSELAAAAPMRLPLQLVSAVRGELNDPLTPILAVGAAASAVLGSTVDALLVLAALGTNAVVGGVQRLRAERALASLVATHTQKARRVLGAGDQVVDQIEVINAAQLARGDVIELAVGDVVPADARLLELNDLEVDESALTGESLPVTKQVAACVGGSVGQRRCMVFDGTTVVAGRARAVVVDIGEHTEAARAITLASRTPPAAGVQARLRELTSKALPLTLLGGAAVTGLSLLRGRSIHQALSGGVAVAVAAVPEGLPLVATVAQMAAARRLSQRGILVRTPRVLEALGRMDTVCFDKTGTLTENQLRVVRVTTRDGAAHLPTEPAARAVLHTAARACPQEQQPFGQHSHATDEAVRAAAPPDPDWEQIFGQPSKPTAATPQPSVPPPLPHS
jgi:cation-transporting ATPase I